MILQFDAGNTRVKWRLTGFDHKMKHEHQMIGSFLMEANSPEWDEKFCRYFSEIDFPSVRRVLVSNVRGSRFGKVLVDLVRSLFSVEPDLAQPSRLCAGVTCGYRAPETLGVDRWLSLLAAYNDAKKNCWILSCGTTITLDFVDASGMHAGGYIVPGFRLMQHALESRIPKLVADVEQLGGMLPGRDTSEAINHGLLAMVVGFVARISREQTASGRPTSWIVTGGDGEKLVPFLECAVEWRPALVMEGLFYAFPD